MSCLQDGRPMSSQFPNRDLKSHWYLANAIATSFTARLKSSIIRREDIPYIAIRQTLHFLPIKVTLSLGPVSHSAEILK
jgi:hypothetical protein